MYKVATNSLDTFKATLLNILLHACLHELSPGDIMVEYGSDEPSSSISFTN